MHATKFKKRALFAAGVSLLLAAAFCFAGCRESADGEQRGTDLAETVRDAAQTAKEKIEDSAETIADRVSEGASKVGNNVSEDVSAAGGKVKEGVSRANDALEEGATRVSEAVSDLMDGPDATNAGNTD